MTTAVRRELPQLVDFDRVREALARFELDAVVCSLAHNVHYLSGLDSPAMWHFPDYAFAIVPRVGDPVLVMSLLGMGALTEAHLWIVDVFPFTRGDNIVYDAGALLESEQLLYEIRDTFQPKMSESPHEAIAKALRDRGLERGKIGFDDPGQVGKVPLDGIQGFDAVDVLRSVRMIKTEPEIQRMRDAAAANEEAALEAIKVIPMAKTFDDVINRYKAAFALRGGDARYFLTGSPSRGGIFQHQFKDYGPQRGEFFIVDALGAKNHYHGDFGRTVSWGAPEPKVRKRFDAMRRAFEAGYELSRPGVPLSTVREAVIETARKEGFPQFMTSTPHSVGMEHTDMPRTPGQVLRANMTMNIDIVYMEAGFGALHLEDTFLVRENGNELLTSGQTELIVVE